MTTNTSPKNICETGCGRRLTPANRADLKRGADSAYRYMCMHCYDEAGLENEHQDGHHDEQRNDRCPMCIDQIDVVTPEQEEIMTKAGEPRSARSHAECYAQGIHAKSREGRQACRDGKFTGDR